MEALLAGGHYFQAISKFWTNFPKFSIVLILYVRRMGNEL